MYATIQLSPYIFIQGLVSRHLPGGMVAIQVRESEYVGSPIAARRR